MSDQDIEDFLECDLEPALHEMIQEAMHEQYNGYHRRKSTGHLTQEILRMVAEKLKQGISQ